MTQRQEEFAAMHRDGLSYVEIAAACGVSPQRVQYALNGQIRNRKNQPLEQRILYPRIVEYLLDEGITAAELGRRAGLTSHRYYQGLTGKQDLRKGEIDAILRVVGGTYEEVFREEA